MYHRDLVKITLSTEESIKWLQDKNVVPLARLCAHCDNFRTRFTKNKLGYGWRCGRCDTYYSLYENTILYNSKLSIEKIIDLIYFWCKNDKQTEVSAEIATKSKQTAGVWFPKLQKLAYFIMREEGNKKIGGPGKIVEIDESKFSKRKYNVGRSIRSPWVVGGIEVDSGESFFVEVFFRDKTTLSAIIREHVEVGTTIYTDCWKGYIDLNAMGYIHLTVNHQENFIDPETGANTQMIEGDWSVYKRMFRERCITYNSDLTLVFAEFMLKRKFKKTAFEKIISELPDSLNKIDF